jgi:hypothetical protein
MFGLLHRVNCLTDSALFQDLMLSARFAPIEPEKLLCFLLLVQQWGASKPLILWPYVATGLKFWT